MLRACKRLLRRSGRIAYLTIVTAPGLDRAAYREAVRIGPPAVAARAPDDVLMRQARFVDVEITDVTTEFRSTARAWRTQFARHETDVKALIGEATWEERQASRADMLRGINEGLLRRVLVSGTAMD